MNLQMIQNVQSIRAQTEELCRRLVIEDYVIQSMTDVSPPKWHLAHTTWFFETFVLLPHLPKYQVFDASYHFLFNSYYHGLGRFFPREQRGLLSRPTVEKIYSYREYVNKYLVDLIDQSNQTKLFELKSLIDLGLNHEQQHQELLLMDIKYNFSLNPDLPVYQVSKTNNQCIQTNLTFCNNDGGTVEIGSNSREFCFDIELPRHQKFLKPFALANRLTTNKEYCEFIDAGGYSNARYWLSDGWDLVQKNKWAAPLYWYKSENEWFIFTLSGVKKLDPNEPVAHISFFEADAYARWRNQRLPTEEEWEHYVIQKKIPIEGNFMEKQIYHPQAINTENNKSTQFFGDLWEWTQSPYVPYPGFKPLPGVLGEYSGKFMNNQFVLRGGCCATPQSHIRATYRNFFQPDKRWQFSGIRLATDL